MKPAVFLGRDGTLIVDKDYRSRPDEVMSASFNCAGIKVLNAVPSKRGRRPNIWVTDDHLAKLS